MAKQITRQALIVTLIIAVLAVSAGASGLSVYLRSALPPSSVVSPANNENADKVYVPCPGQLAASSTNNCGYIRPDEVSVRNDLPPLTFFPTLNDTWESLSTRPHNSYLEFNLAPHKTPDSEGFYRTAHGRYKTGSADPDPGDRRYAHGLHQPYLTYYPDPEFIGQDTITYQASSIDDYWPRVLTNTTLAPGTATTTITINVEPPPGSVTEQINLKTDEGYWHQEEGEGIIFSQPYVYSEDSRLKVYIHDLPNLLEEEGTNFDFSWIDSTTEQDGEIRLINPQAVGEPANDEEPAYFVYYPRMPEPSLEDNGPIMDHANLSYNITDANGNTTPRQATINFNNGDGDGIREAIELQYDMDPQDRFSQRKKDPTLADHVTDGIYLQYLSAQDTIKEHIINPFYESLQQERRQEGGVISRDVETISFTFSDPDSGQKITTSALATTSYDSNTNTVRVTYDLEQGNLRQREKVTYPDRTTITSDTLSSGQTRVITYVSLDPLWGASDRSERARIANRLAEMLWERRWGELSFSSDQKANIALVLGQWLADEWHNHVPRQNANYLPGSAYLQVEEEEGEVIYKFYFNPDPSSAQGKVTIVPAKFGPAPVFSQEIKTQSTIYAPGAAGHQVVQRSGEEELNLGRSLIVLNPRVWDKVSQRPIENSENFTWHRLYPLNYQPKNESSLPGRFVFRQVINNHAQERLLGLGGRHIQKIATITRHNWQDYYTSPGLFICRTALSAGFTVRPNIISLAMSTIYEKKFVGAGLDLAGSVISPSLFYGPKYSVEAWNINPGALPPEPWKYPDSLRPYLDSIAAASPADMTSAVNVLGSALSMWESNLRGTLAVDSNLTRDQMETQITNALRQIALNIVSQISASAESNHAGYQTLLGQLYRQEREYRAASTGPLARADITRQTTDPDTYRQLLMAPPTNKDLADTLLFWSGNYGAIFGQAAADSEGWGSYLANGALSATYSLGEEATESLPFIAMLGGFQGALGASIRGLEAATPASRALVPAGTAPGAVVPISAYQKVANLLRAGQTTIHYGVMSSFAAGTAENLEAFTRALAAGDDVAAFDSLGGLTLDALFWGDMAKSRLDRSRLLRKYEEAMPAGRWYQMNQLRGLADKVRQLFSEPLHETVSREGQAELYRLKPEKAALLKEVSGEVARLINKDASTVRQEIEMLAMRTQEASRSGDPAAQAAAAADFNLKIYEPLLRRLNPAEEIILAEKLGATDANGDFIPWQPVVGQLRLAEDATLTSLALMASGENTDLGHQASSPNESTARAITFAAGHKLLTGQGETSLSLPGNGAEAFNRLAANPSLQDPLENCRALPLFSPSREYCFGDYFEQPAGWSLDRAAPTQSGPVEINLLGGDTLTGRITKPFIQGWMMGVMPLNKWGRLPRIEHNSGVTLDHAHQSIDIPRPLADQVNKERAFINALGMAYQFIEVLKPSAGAPNRWHLSGRAREQLARIAADPSISTSTLEALLAEIALRAVLPHLDGNKYQVTSNNPFTDSITILKEFISLNFGDSPATQTGHDNMVRAIDNLLRHSPASGGGTMDTNQQLSFIFRELRDNPVSLRGSQIKVWSKVFSDNNKLSNQERIQNLMLRRAMLAYLYDYFHAHYHKTNQTIGAEAALKQMEQYFTDLYKGYDGNSLANIQKAIAAMRSESPLISPAQPKPPSPVSPRASDKPQPPVPPAALPTGENAGPPVPGGPPPVPAQPPPLPGGPPPLPAQPPPVPQVNTGNTSLKDREGSSILPGLPTLAEIGRVFSQAFTIDEYINHFKNLLGQPTTGTPSTRQPEGQEPRDYLKQLEDMSRWLQQEENPNLGAGSRNWDDIERQFFNQFSITPSLSEAVTRAENIIASLHIDDPGYNTGRIGGFVLGVKPALALDEPLSPSNQEALHHAFRQAGIEGQFYNQIIFNEKQIQQRIIAQPEVAQAVGWDFSQSVRENIQSSIFPDGSFRDHMKMGFVLGFPASAIKDFDRADRLTTKRGIPRVDQILLRPGEGTPMTSEEFNRILQERADEIRNIYHNTYGLTHSEIDFLLSRDGNDINNPEGEPVYEFVIFGDSGRNAADVKRLEAAVREAYRQIGR